MDPKLVVTSGKSRTTNLKPGFKEFSQIKLQETLVYDLNKRKQATISTSPQAYKLQNKTHNIVIIRYKMDISKKSNTMFNKKTRVIKV